MLLVLLLVLVPVLLVVLVLRHAHQWTGKIERGDDIVNGFSALLRGVATWMCDSLKGEQEGAAAAAAAAAAAKVA